VPIDEALARVLELVRSEPARPDDSQLVLGQLQRLCRAAAAELPAAGVGVSVIAEAGHQLTAASSPVHAAVEELQFTLGEGPCLSAYDTGAPVLTPDVALTAIRRWPGYALAVQEYGVGAIFAFPLQVGAARLGALDVYQDQPGPMPRKVVSQALIFAEVAMNMLLDASRASQDPESPSIDEMLDGNRAELYQAQGMVMVQLGVTLPEAMSRLRAYAYAHERRLTEVAAAVVARRISIDGDDE
jgi:hypothetical protein